jgi:hypothetical protein
VVQHNSTAVIGLSETNSRMLQLQLDHIALSVKFTALTKERGELDVELAEKTEKLQIAQSKLRGQDSEVQTKVDEMRNQMDQQKATVSLKTCFFVICV